MSELIGEYVRVRWPGHPTDGWIGQVRGFRRGLYRVLFNVTGDGSTRPYNRGDLIKVRSVTTWVDAE